MNTIKKNKTVKQIMLDLEADGTIQCDISHRGGSYYGFAHDVVRILFPTLSAETLEDVISRVPNKIGVYCNYLGGGLRGAIGRTDYDKSIPAKYAKRIDAFTRECKARYMAIENRAGLNADEYADGDTNWEARGTTKVRAAGVKAAY